MTGHDVRAWRGLKEWSQIQAATALGLSRHQFDIVENSIEVDQAIEMAIHLLQFQIHKAQHIAAEIIARVNAMPKPGRPKLERRRA